MKEWKDRIPGTLLCFVIALVAWILVESIDVLEIMGTPVMAVLFGMILSMAVPVKQSFKPGIAFTSKKVLQAAVVLLGFGLNLSTVGSIGSSSLPIILSTISVSLLMAFVLQKALKIPVKTATLVGVGSSICGGSAIAATAPVIEADDDEIAQSISVIFLFNVIAAIIFPTLGGMLGLSNDSFGLFAGTAINDTSSVTAAAATWDTMHGTGGAVLEYATVVKLTRTLAIIPITVGLSLYRMKKNKTENRSFSLKSVLPMFIVYFVLASVITTILTSVCTGTALVFVKEIFSILKKLSKFFIAMAMAAIGLNTNPVKLVKTGGKAIVLGFCCWVSIAVVSLAMQSWLMLYNGMNALQINEIKRFK